MKSYNYIELDKLVLESCSRDIDILFQLGYTKPNLSQQTFDNLFDPTNNIWNSNWQKLNETFLTSLKLFTGLDFANYKAWVFACFPGTESVQNSWHTHPNSLYSGILYLSLPVGSKTTEFQNADGTTWSLEPLIGSWFIFDSKLVHRPGQWDHRINLPRYCLAASAW